MYLVFINSIIINDTKIINNLNKHLNLNNKKLRIFFGTFLLKVYINLMLDNLKAIHYTTFKT